VLRLPEALHRQDNAKLCRSQQTVVHSQDEYVRGDAHTNTAENYFSILKRGIYGIYQHTSEEHLHRDEA
jgi:hypothetical protein